MQVNDDRILIFGGTIPFRYYIVPSGRFYPNGDIAKTLKVVKFGKVISEL